MNEEVGCGCSKKPLADCRGATEYRLQSPMTLGTTITWREVVGAWRVRWGFHRMRYLIAPGLYRIGQPGSTSPVLVTANERPRS